ncbi:MAG: hypothetical protein HUJ52_03530, partial [Malacoplasma sp.]|nr:hypothetical protein [Malacoplasma sp.]
INPWNEFKAWGLFYEGSDKLFVNNLTATIIFWITLGVFFAIPYLNDLFIKLRHKDYEYPFVWEKREVPMPEEDC